MATAAEVRAAKAAYYVAHREAIKARVREYYASHPDEVAAYRAANRERRNAQRRAWGITNANRVRESNAARDPQALRASARAYHAAHADERSQKSQKWRAANPEMLREQGRRYRVENTAKVYDKNAKRRARLKGARVENVSRAIVYERDGGLCGICSQSIAQKDFTLDHIIPLSRGGEHSYRNVQAAHRRCNSSKGSRVA